MNCLMESIGNLPQFQREQLRYHHLQRSSFMFYVQEEVSEALTNIKSIIDSTLIEENWYDKCKNAQFLKLSFVFCAWLGMQLLSPGHDV